MANAPNTWTGQLCTGGTCLTASEVQQRNVAWRELLQLTPPPAKPTCSAHRCRPLALDPWETCAKHNSQTVPCLMPNPQCGISCAGSIGEESFALIALLAASRGANISTRPTGSPRVRSERGCAGAMSPMLRNGTFLELGANNGFASNTRHLEYCLGWRGLLIEGHPQNFRALNASRSTALSLASAVCPEHGWTLFSRRAGPTTGILSSMSGSHRVRWRHSSGPNGTLAVPCGPLGDWLRLLRMEEIDYLSLDVEGAEALVLQTVDWTALRVGVLISECANAGCTSYKDQLVRRLLESQGLRLVALLRVRSDIYNAAFLNTSWRGTFSLS
jgi:FkbM family methyltransferase